MRIIAGTLKGRAFNSPLGHKTHPMSEKTRGAIFNMLGEIEGMTLFDAFAGSGAIAFEAISREAKSALATDISKDAYNVTLQNAKKLGIEKKVKVVRANASGWSDNNVSAVFDIVVADPPYDDVNMALLHKLTKHVRSGGLYIVSLPSQLQFVPPLFEQLSFKQYGDANIWIYRKLG